MIANTAKRFTLRLRKDAFDVRAREVFGDLRQYEIAERLNTDASTLSLLRQGRRTPTVPFICDTLVAFRRPNEIAAEFHDHFELVPAVEQERAA